MTTDNKSNKETEVPANQTNSEEVVKSGITENEIVADILGDSSPAKSEESTPDEDTAEDAEDDKGGSDDQGEEEPKADDKKADDEEEPEEETNSDEVFATVGGQKFKTKEDLIKFASSNTGYNTWLTGTLKSLHPELFNEDGSIKSKDIQNLIKSKGKSAEKAAEVIADVADKKAEDVTDEDLADVEKAKAILRPLGVVFADDPEYKKLQKHSQVLENKEVEEVRATVTAFEEKHPLLKEHRVAVADLMDRNDYDLETAWKVHKTIAGIVEEEETTKRPDVVVKKAADSAIPATIKKQSGNLPTSGGKDFMDDLISLNP